MCHPNPTGKAVHQERAAAVPHRRRNGTQAQHEAGVTQPGQQKNSNLGTSRVSSASSANGSDTTGQIVPDRRRWEQWKWQELTT